MRATLFLNAASHKAATTLHGVMPTAELQFLLEQRDGSDQLLFGSAPPEPNAIFLLELMAVLASLRKLQPLLKGARAPVFTDNDASRHALVKGDSSATTARWIA